MRRVLLASDRGYLRFETVRQLRCCGLTVTAAASDTASQQRLESLGIETLTPVLPQWPREKTVTRPPGFQVPETWKKAIQHSDVIIYSPEPEADWQAFAPEYRELTWPVIELETAACAAGVSRLICLHSGKSIGYTRSHVVEEWDGTSFIENITDPYEYQRGTQLPERLVHQLYLTYLHQRKNKKWLECLVKPPVTELILLQPVYSRDPERARLYDAGEKHSAVEVSRFRMRNNGDTDFKQASWPDSSLLEALQRLMQPTV